jgi:hypothetical protein
MRDAQGYLNNTVANGPYVARFPVGAEGFNGGSLGRKHVISS